ncbi:MAG: hypothetical protein F6K26_22890 [Moorea sp. SIO2I5]|nr:hypothetical protein [Moorena sp. SIO2I5]
MNSFVGFTWEPKQQQKKRCSFPVAWPFGQGVATGTQKSRITGYIMSGKIPIIKGKVGSLGSLGRAREYGDMGEILIKGNYPEMI